MIIYTNVRFFKIVVILTSAILISCSGGYEQQYDDYSEFDKINQRNKGWFPDFISEDATNLKNESYLDPLCAFGSFSYTNDRYYDSVFTSSKVEKIDFDVFREKVSIHEDRRPDWFPIWKSKYIFEAIKVDRFYVMKDNLEKKIYFILTN